MSPQPQPGPADPGGLDAAAARHAIASALDGSAGPALIVSVLAAVPGVIHTPARRGLFRSEPERVQLGSWRYEPTADGRGRPQLRWLEPFLR